jgi:hypothetical protein
MWLFYFSRFGIVPFPQVMNSLMAACRGVLEEELPGSKPVVAVYNSTNSLRANRVVRSSCRNRKSS